MSELARAMHLISNLGLCLVRCPPPSILWVSASNGSESRPVVRNRKWHPRELRPRPSHVSFLRD